VQSWLAEGYLGRGREPELARLAGRARSAAEGLAGEGVHVSYDHSTFVPEDEVCLHFFRSDSADAVAEALRRAAVEYERIVEAQQGERALNTTRDHEEGT
jgi:hypothetical protein